ncbi:uncharacterized protein LOC142168791 [Nicotiana tabacum]|uniref:Uncharacterized protein LOC142168791 n=1 Tax=Nicotiana tabacum TaxID=4097 RepID=A0AC58SM50_TOBAC
MAIDMKDKGKTIEQEGSNTSETKETHGSRELDQNHGIKDNTQASSKKAVNTISYNSDEKIPNLEDYVNGSTSIPSEIKALPGIDLVVDINAEKEVKAYRWVEGDDNISKAAIHHFQKLFNIKHQFNDYDIFNFIPKCITADDNAHLTAIPDTEEIKESIFNMSASSVAGLDGYNGTFFQKCWEIIKEEIKKFIQDYFNGKRMTMFFSHTCVVLIPKVDTPSNFSELRPISLSNFTSKIILKFLAIRLNPMLGKLISENQSGFVK